MSKDGEEIKEQCAKVLEKTYDDLLHPSMQAIGKTLSLLPRTIGIWLSKWEKWIINGEESIRLTAEAVKEKASNIPEDKLTEPEPYVAIPAIQQLSYCADSSELREMYANLLISSMNSDTKWKVHPSFVDIVKQLTPDEAKLLKLLYANPIQPIIDVKVNLEDNKGYYVRVHNFTSISEGICDNPSSIFSYLDNLSRLRLIEISKEIFLTDNSKYEPLINHPEIVTIMSEKLSEGRSHEIKKGKFELTDFGKDFCAICL